MFCSGDKHENMKTVAKDELYDVRLDKCFYFEISIVNSRGYLYSHFDP